MPSPEAMACQPGTLIRWVPTLPTELAGFSAHLEQTEGSARTVRAYLADAGEFAAFLSGGPPSMDSLEGWAASLNHGRLRPQSVRRKLTAARRWLAFQARHGDATAKETLAILAGGYRVGPVVRQRDRKEVRPVELDDYLEARTYAPPWGRAVLDFLWHTGARIGEVVGDRISDIPPLTLGQGRELVGQGWTATVGKGGKRRILVMSSKGRAALREWIGREIGPDSAPLFPSPRKRGEAMTAGAVWSMLRRSGLKSGPHAFRHAFKSRLRAAGIESEVRRAIMGHGPKDAHEGYGQITPEEMLRAVEQTEAR